MTLARVRTKSELTLGVLRTLTSFVQTDFLTLNLTGIASNKACFTQFGTQGFIVLHQSTSDTVADRTSLTGNATTVNGDVQVQFLGHLNQFQRLTNYHAGSRTAEVLLQGALVDYDFTATRFDKYASSGAFATAGTVVLIFCHCCQFPLDIQYLRLLSSMSVLGACVNFQLTEHGTAQRTLRQHAFDGSFDYHFRFTLNQLVEADGLDTTRETGVSMVHFVGKFLTGYVYLLSVYNDDVITGVNVRSVLSFVLTTQTSSDLGCDTTQSFTFCVHNVPVTFYGFWLGNESFH